MSSDPKQKSDLIGELIGEFRTSGNNDDAFDNLAALRLGVNETDLHCLNIIQNSGGVTAGELAKAAGLTTGAVTGVIDRLERVGFARRVADPDDRRRVKLEVTPKFYSRTEKIWGPVAKDWSTALGRQYSAEELNLIIGFLRRTNEITETHLERLRRAK
jgi:DNA-binding MarR family transcriptional regulator